MDTLEYKGYTIEVKQDENAESPREWDNFGHMVCFHKRYNLGDKDTNLTSDMFRSWKELENYLINEMKAIIIAPLYMYDHSIQRIKIGNFYNCGLPQGHAQFDSGQIGYIYATDTDIKENFDVQRITKKVIEQAKKVIEGEVNTYDAWISGQVYGYNIKNEKDNNLDGCWGYYGDIEYMINEAKIVIDNDIKYRRIEKQKRIKAYIKNKVALQYRKV